MNCDARRTNGLLNRTLQESRLWQRKPRRRGNIPSSSRGVDTWSIQGGQVLCEFFARARGYMKLESRPTVPGMGNPANRGNAKESGAGLEHSL